MGQQTIPSSLEAVHSLDPHFLLQEFLSHFQSGTPRFFYAPGRVNLIGEHTDYNQGFVLPIAINRGTLIAGSARSDQKICVYSISMGETVEFDLGGSPLMLSPGHWSNYVYGVVRVLEEHGHSLVGADLMIASNIPTGAGLSSSAALENATSLALLSLSNVSVPDKIQIAQMSQQAEHQYVGTQCGIMDQLVSAMGLQNQALLINCKSLTTRAVPINLPNMAIVICDSQVKHELSSSAYNQRVSECQQGLAYLQQALPQIKSLSDIDEQQLEQFQSLINDHIILKRLRHVVSENARTLKMVEALKTGDTALIGQLMQLSHESLKNDYEVSCPELDTLVDIARSIPGTIGSRMTGGGFGGCTVNLVQEAGLADFMLILTAQYREAFGFEPQIYITPACTGMHEILMDNTISQDKLRAELNQRFDQVFEPAFENDALSPFINFIQEQLPPFSEPAEGEPVAATITSSSDHTLPAAAHLSQGNIRLSVSREFGIRLFYQEQELTTNIQNIPFDYPWFKPDPDDSEDIPGFAAAHVARGSRGESPWPEAQWPLIGGVLQGEQNWPHREAAFGPYQLEITQDVPYPVIHLSLPHHKNRYQAVNAYGVTPRALFALPTPTSVLIALQHENHSLQGLAWAPWLVLGFAVPESGSMTNPSTILAFPDSHTNEPLQPKMRKVWNYMNINGLQLALINPHAKTLNEPFKKLYSDVNWSVIAFKNADYIILTRSILRHPEQFFPFLEHGRHFIEIEHTGPRVGPGEKSIVVIQHDCIPLSVLTQGELKKFSTEKDSFQQEVRRILSTIVEKYKSKQLVTNYWASL
jgi:galactokinase